MPLDSQVSKSKKCVHHIGYDCREKTWANFRLYVLLNAFLVPLGTFCPRKKNTRPLQLRKSLNKADALFCLNFLIDCYVPQSFYSVPYKYVCEFIGIKQFAK